MSDTTFQLPCPEYPEISAIRSTLWANGYVPVPVVTQGKACHFEGWPARGRRGEFAYAQVFPGHLNTGIACQGLRAIDIDVDYEGAVAAILDHAITIFGEPGGVRSRENSPRLLLLYRAADGAPRKRDVYGSGGKIEVLGAGQQFVAHGTHETDVSICWQGDRAAPFPACLPSAAELPPITEEQVGAFLAAVGGLIHSPGEESAGAADVAVRVPNPEKQAPIEQLQAALTVIPNPDLPWDSWKKILLAMWAASGGSKEGRDACRDWSAKSHKHDDDEFDVQWDGITSSPPEQIGAGTLFFLAREASPGWRIPSSRVSAETAQVAFAASPLPSSEAGDHALQMVAGLPGFLAPPSQLPPPQSRQLHIIRPSELQGRPVPRRDWIVPGWLPVGTVAALYGDGGTGKTLLAQQLMTACATGRTWCGMPVKRCKSFALFCEDDDQELHRRQAAMNAALGVAFSDLEDMRWASGVGQDNSLAAFPPDGSVITMPTYDALHREVMRHGAKLVVLDTAADLFLGNENDRGQVRRFIRLLARLALDIDGAVILNAHPSRAGKKGDLDGGSTAWSNSVRSRWSLSRPRGEADTPERILECRKANYAGIGEQIRLRWADGVLMPLADTGDAAKAARGERAEYVFLTLLRHAVSDKNLSMSRNSTNYAPRVFCGRSGAEDFTQGELQSAMERLHDRGQIITESYGKKSEGRKRICLNKLATD